MSVCVQRHVDGGMPRCTPAQLVEDSPWVTHGKKGEVSRGSKGVHRVVHCRVGSRPSTAPPLNVMHVGAWDNNVGDNLALDHVQHHITDHLLPHRGTSTAIFHLLDLKYHFLEMNNELERVLDSFVHIGRMELNVSLIVFGGGGLIQPGYARMGSGWRLPLSQRIASRLGTLPYIVYGVGVNLWRSASAKAFTATEREGMRGAIIGALSFSVRNDGSYAALTGLFPGDEDVKAKVWEVADPGMMLPISRCNLVRPSVINPELPSTIWPFGRCAFQPAWNSDPAVNAGRMGTAGLEALAKLATTARFVFLPHTPAKDFAFHALLKSTATRLGHAPDEVRENVVSRSVFTSHISIGHHAVLLESLYSSGELQALGERDLRFDAVVPMRGHGLYLCVALNIPCVALSTQDKVSGFARICDLEDYLVDVGEDAHWAHNLTRKLYRIQTDEVYRSNWYAKRDTCLSRWEGVATRFHSDLRARFWNNQHEHIATTKAFSSSAARRYRAKASAPSGSRKPRRRSSIP